MDSVKIYDTCKQADYQHEDKTQYSCRQFCGHVHTPHVTSIMMICAAAAAGVDDYAPPPSQQGSGAGMMRELVSPAVSSSSGGTIALEVRYTCRVHGRIFEATVVRTRVCGPMSPVHSATVCQR